MDNRREDRRRKYSNDEIHQWRIMSEFAFGNWEIHLFLDIPYHIILFNLNPRSTEHRKKYMRHYYKTHPEFRKNRQEYQRNYESQH